MKIAVANEGKLVSGHFGHCEGFTIYDVNDNKILDKKFVPNPGHKPGFLPVFKRAKGRYNNIWRYGSSCSRAFQ